MSRRLREEAIAEIEASRRGIGVPREAFYYLAPRCFRIGVFNLLYRYGHRGVSDDWRGMSLFYISLPPQVQREIAIALVDSGLARS
jgi:hypothetical protein